jgi:peroxiredoxin
MKKNIVLFLFIPFLIIYSQIPDTLNVKTEKLNGFGPFSSGFSLLETMQKYNPWISTIPQIKGLPQDYSKMMFCTLETDFYQHVYQSYYAGKISEQRFNECKSSWGWEPDSLTYTKRLVKVSIAILAYSDSLGNIKVKVDANNNYDLSDDKWFDIPPTVPGQKLSERIDNYKLINAQYEAFNGKEIKKYNTSLYIDRFPNNKNQSLQKDSPLVLAYAFAEYYEGEFNFNNERYKIALKGGRAVLRSDYIVKIWKKGTNADDTNPDQGYMENDVVRIGDQYYKIISAAFDGSSVKLIRIKDAEKTGGNQVGMRALPFSKISITGANISLDSLNGKYVLLDFWGSWCPPCREEIIKLKDIYEKYSKHNFLIIGIADDSMDKMKSFVEKNNIAWPQILQSDDKSILKLYNIKYYPATFLLDPEGKIINKDIHAEELDKKLSEILN